MILSLSAQPEVQAWGNLRGIRVDGQLFRFETSYRLVESTWEEERATAQERNWTSFSRKEGNPVVETRMGGIGIEQVVEDLGEGKIRLRLNVKPEEAIDLTGLFFHIALPLPTYAGVKLTPLEVPAVSVSNLSGIPAPPAETWRGISRGVRLRNEDRIWQIHTTQAREFLLREEADALGLYVLLAHDSLQVSHTYQYECMIEVNGSRDTQTAHLKLFPQYPGNEFLGLGGNFRLQNQEKDPMVIDYCLANLDVRMGRVELPWQHWHPHDSLDPLAEARAGRIHPRVVAAMEMAQRLSQMGTPVLTAAWFPPSWAAQGEVSREAKNPDGSYGNPLDQQQARAIYESLTAYHIYLKEAYGVEVSMFSFNESDLGINVRQTPEEHAKLIRELGAHLQKRGLKTKLLLGDTSDANAFEFVNAALDDPETWAYIGAVSFHSWRGWTKETLLEWYEAADRLNVPLIVGEGSIDAAAWRYPVIFTEPHYAMEEIKLYVRMLSICQPKTILQWQLTADYSPMMGQGLAGTQGELRPTQRFFNLQQLATTPPGLRAIPLTCENAEVFAAALGSGEQLAIHMVNGGPDRTVELTGIPRSIKRLQLWITDQDRGMEAGAKVRVKNGTAVVELPAACFASLFSQ